MDETKFLSQFGDHLYHPSSKQTLATADLLANKTVLLYFSAHWCPPCRRFTPLLMELYQKLKQDDSKKFELVFVSLDHTESEYFEYVSNMPWHCVPFASEEQRQKLPITYKAEGIPHLVVVDSQQRKIVTTEGTSEVQLDPDGTNFPWKPKGFSELFPDKLLLTKSGEMVDSSALDKKHLMLYFSAHWCGPCRGFTPKLVKAYQKLKEQQGGRFELVFVSSDRDLESFNDYYGEMPWLALPFEERQAKNGLSKLFGVRGIPCLLILGPISDDGDRPLINNNLRGIIESNDFSEFPFPPKPYQDLSQGADGINEHKSLVLFCENADDDEQAEILAAIKKVAEKPTNKDMKFFYATQPGGLVTAIRKVIKKEHDMENVVVALLNIPDNGGYYISPEVDDLTAEKLQQFLVDPGTRKQMSRR